MRILVPILALILGFFGGQLLPQLWKSSPGDDVGAGDPGQKLRGKTGTGGQKVSSSSRRPGSGISTIAVTAQLEDAFRHGRTDYHSVKALVLALTAMSPETIPEFAAFLRKQPFDRSQVLLWQMVFTAWAEINPRVAIAFIEGRFTEPAARRVFYGSVLEMWRVNEPDLALEFALEKFRSPELADESHLAIEYLRELAKTDPEQAIELASKLHDGEHVFDLTAKKISQLGEKDWQLALDEVEKLSGELHVHAASQLVNDWAREEPAKAAAWLAENYVADMGLHTLAQVAGEYLNADPDAALEWLRGLPEAGNHDRILAAGVAAWAQRNPDAAAEWVGNLELSQANDAAVVAVGSQLSGGSPQAVIEELVPRIVDARRGNELLYEASLNWQRDEPEQYARWLEETSALSPETRQRLMIRELPGPDAESASQPETSPATTRALDQGRE